MDFKKLAQEYKQNDFGFTTASDEQFTNTRIETEKNLTKAQVTVRLKKIEDLVPPLFINLLETADNPHIFWPNRKEVMEAKIEELLELTRE